MNQNDLVALGLGALVIGGLAVLGPKLGQQEPEPRRPPGVNPLPSPFPPAPGPGPTPGGGEDPQLEAARQAIAALVTALQAQGGGTPAQREQAAQTLEAQANTLEASRQSPQAVALLRQAAQQLRSGQLPNVPPSPNPSPPPTGPTGPFPFPFPPFTPPVAPGTGQAATAPEPSADLMARYTELRERCADFLQGARAIDQATLGAADRTSTDLLRAGDMNRAADLGALATASYARAGIPRPMPVTA